MSIKTFIGITGGFLSYLLGGWDAMLKALVLLTALDYATGLIAGAVQGKISSQIGFKGIAKKAGMFCIVALSSIVDSVFPGDLIRNITIVFYCGNEGISILENVAKAGVKYPKKLKKMLEQLNKDGAA